MQQATIGGVVGGRSLAGSGDGGSSKVPVWLEGKGGRTVDVAEASPSRPGIPGPPSFLRSGYTPTAVAVRSEPVAGGNVGGFRIDKDVIKASVLAQIKPYYDHLFGKGANSGTSIQYSCPFHDDRSPSLSVSKEHGGWACHAGSCDKKGDIFKAWMLVKGQGFGDAIKSVAEWVGDPSAIPRKSLKEAKARGGTVEITDSGILRDLSKAQKAIFVNDKVMKILLDRYGVTKESVARFKLGFERRSYRLWIPVYNKGKLTGIRKHDIMRAHCCWMRGTPATKDTLASDDYAAQSTDPPDPENWRRYWGSKVCRKMRPRKQGGKVIGVSGHNSLTMYPSSVLGVKKLDIDDQQSESKQWITLTGGELKAVYLNQQGVPAVTFTGGEGKFSTHWLRKFSGLDVDVCMDADKAGVEGAERVAKALTKFARKVRIVDLPHGDVNDYYKDKGWQFDDWAELPRRIVKDESRRASKIVQFKDLRNAEYVGEEVQFRAIVAGSGDTPFFVPSEMKATCKRGQADPIPSCANCKLAKVGFEIETSLPPEDLIEIRSKGPKRQIKYLREVVAGVPDRCPHPDIKFKSRRIAEIGIVKDVDTIDTWEEQDQGAWFVQKVYYVDKGDIPENEPVQCFGKIIADPSDSRATMVLRRMQQVRRSFEVDSISARTEAMLATLPGGNDSVEQVADRLSWFVEEFEQRITHIYEQRHLIMGSLLLWFMPIRFKIFGKPNEKISAEVLLLGDTRAGKTSVGKTMLRHFKAGRFVQCEGATFAGLVGGSGEHGAKKFFTWGVLPSQDGGFVLMDEIDDIVRSGVFGQLTSIRSDGVASRVIAGGVRQASSRLRMLMASNPLGNRRMRNYSSTMYAVNELLKAPQDIARYEYAIGVYRPDDPAIYNVTPDPTPSPYSQDYAAEHVRWAWRQMPQLDGEVADRIMEVSSKVSNEFRELVLLTASEARWKVARIACAIAALCYSRRGGRVLVNVHHVDIAGAFLRQIYGPSSDFRYDKFVKNETVDSKDLRSYMTKLGKAAVNFMVDNDSFSQDMIETMCEGRSSKREFMRVMTMEHKCMRRHRTGYIKTQGFKDFLDKVAAE